MRSIIRLYNSGFFVSSSLLYLQFTELKMIYASKNLTYSIIFFMNFLDGIQHGNYMSKKLFRTNLFWN